MLLDIRVNFLLYCIANWNGTTDDVNPSQTREPKMQSQRVIQTSDAYKFVISHFSEYALWFAAVIDCTNLLTSIVYVTIDLYRR